MKLSKPLEQAPPTSVCPCSLCTYRASASLRPRTEQQAIVEGSSRTYTWLLEQLGEVSAFTSVAFNVPDTVLYRKAKIHWVLLQGKASSLRFTRTHPKHSDLRKKLIRASTRRKLSFLSAANKPEDALPYGKEVALVRYMRTDNCHFNGADEDGPTRVMTDLELINLMDERPGSNVWRSINYIQSVVRCRAGLGRTFVYQFTATDFAMEQTSAESVRDRCLVASKQLAFHLQKYRGKQIQSIKTEFMQDDNGDLWLIYATNLKVSDVPVDQTLLRRPAPKRTVTYQQSLAPVREPKGELQEHQQRMTKRMHKYYQRMRNRSGIEEMLKKVPSNQITFDAFRVLRPHQSVCFDAAPKAEEQPVMHVRNRSQAIVRVSPERLSQPVRQKSLDRSWEYHPKVRVRPVVHFRDSHLPKRSASRLFS